jgi:hypothetical protein
MEFQRNVCECRSCRLLAPARDPVFNHYPTTASIGGCAGQTPDRRLKQAKDF